MTPFNDEDGIKKLLHTINPNGLVLASTGPLAIGSKGAPDRLEFAGTADAAVAIASRYNDRNVYFTPAVFASSKRSAANAISCNAFWVDIDVRPGDGKSYEDAETARASIDVMLQTLGLPQPTIVNTGGGFHLYWITDTNYDKSTWKPVSMALRRVLTAYDRAYGAKIAADTARITDIASVMRLPGTYNRTRNARCYIDSVAPIIAGSAFEAALVSAESVCGGVAPTATPSHGTLFGFGGLSGSPAPSVPPTPNTLSGFGGIGAVSAPSNPASPGTLSGFGGLSGSPAPSIPQSTTPVKLSGFGSIGGEASPTNKPSKASDLLARATAKLKDAAVDTNIKPTYAQLLSNCALIRRLAEEPDAVDEPTWRYALNVVMQTEEGVAAAHEFSCGYKNYSAEETEAKANNAAAIDRPTLCETLRDTSKVGFLCTGCGLNKAGVSPVKGAVKRVTPAASAGESALSVAGRYLQIEAINAALATNTVATKTLNGTSYPVWDIAVLNPKTQNPDPSIVVPVPPKGYTFGYTALGAAGVYSLTDVSKPLCPDILFIDRRVESVDSTIAGRLMFRLHHYDVHGKHYVHYLTPSDLDSQRSTRTALANLGIVFNATDALLDYIYASVETARVTGEYPIYSTTSYGWYNIGGQRMFVTPMGTYNEGGDVEPVIQPRISDDGACVLSEHSAADIGDLDEWRVNYQRMFGNSPYAGWAILASLSSPLFYVARNDGSQMSSFVIVLSGETGSGKTYLAQVCQSIWSAALTMVPGHSTTNALEQEAAAMRHIPLVVDDVTTDAKGLENLRKYFLMASGGRGKSRLGRNMRLEAISRWHNLTLMTSNISLAEVISAIDVRGGASTRMLEIAVMTAARQKDSPETVRSRSDLLTSGSGALGCAFIKRLLQYTDAEIVNMVRDAEASLTDVFVKTGMEDFRLGQLRMRRRMIALTAVVADLMRDVLPFNAQQAVQWAVDSCISGTFSAGTRTKPSASSRMQALHMVHGVVSTNVVNTFRVIGCARSALEADETGTERYVPVPIMGFDVSYADRQQLTATDGTPCHGVYEYCIRENLTRTRSGAAPFVLMVLSPTTEVIGYYVAADKLGSGNSAVILSKNGIIDALGECHDGTPRKSRVVIPAYVSGGKNVSGTYVWVSSTEIDEYLNHDLSVKDY